jgi:hypothetical protein
VVCFLYIDWSYMKFSLEIRSQLVFIAFFVLCGQAEAAIDPSPGCMQLLTLDESNLPTMSLSLRQMIAHARNRTSPTLALAQMMEAHPRALTEIYLQRTLSPKEWRELSETAFAQSVPETFASAEQRRHVFDSLFQGVNTSVEIFVRPPAQEGVRKGLFGLFRRRESKPPSFLDALDLQSSVQRLWKIEGLKGGLRLASSTFFADVPEFPKYRDTFNWLIEKLATAFEEETTEWPQNWMEWTVHVANFLKAHFAESSSEQRQFIVVSLESIFLRIPELTAPGEALSALMAEKSGTALVSAKANETTGSTSIPSGKKPRKGHQNLDRGAHEGQKESSRGQTEPEPDDRSQQSFKVVWTLSAQQFHDNLTDSALRKKIKDFEALWNMPTNERQTLLSSKGWHSNKYKEQFGNFTSGYLVRLNARVRLAYTVDYSSRTVTVVGLFRVER